MIGKLGIWEIMAIIAVIALVFGVKRLPDLGNVLGETIHNFKKAIKKDEEQQ